MYLFSFENIDKESINAAKVQFPTDQIVYLDGKTAEKIKPQPFVVLGHSSDRIKGNILSGDETVHTVGKLSASRMAKKFSAMVAKEQRTEIHDIYLIACEAGWNDSEDNPCFARQLAVEMYKQGFTNINVHAITSPQDCGEQYQGMTVELITKEGSATRAKTGDTRTWLHTKEYEKIVNQIHQKELEKATLAGKIDDLKKLNRADTSQTREELKKVIGRINREINDLRLELKKARKGHVFMETASLREEFDRPENTFKGANNLQSVTVKSKSMRVEQNRLEARSVSGAVKRRTNKSARNNHNSGARESESDKKAADGQQDKGKDKKSFSEKVRSKLPGTKKNKLTDQEQFKPVSEEDESQQSLLADSTQEKREKKSLAKTAKNLFASTSDKREESAVRKPTEVQEQGSESQQNLPDAVTLYKQKLHTLKQVASYYKYGDDPRGYHFWAWGGAKAGTEEGAFLKAEDKLLRGDALKKKILEYFREALDNSDDLPTTIESIKNSAEYEILRKSQGFVTWMFQCAKNTDSINALDEMIEEKQNPCLAEKKGL